MGIINVSKPPQYFEADEELVRKALKGRVEPHGFPRCIRSHVVRYEEIVKAVEMVDNIPHEVFKKVKKQERYYPDHKSRTNWGYLYRACRRLVDCGVMVSFTLRHNGDLDVVWFKAKKKTVYKQIVKHIPEPIQSTIGEAERMMDTRLEYDHGEWYHKEDTTPDCYFDFNPEYVENAAEVVMWRKAQAVKALHSEEACKERVQEKIDRETPTYLLHLNERIKYSGDRGINQDVVHRNPLPLWKKIEMIREQKGCCAWPNGFNKGVANVY